jgi:hypothetical protein
MPPADQEQHDGDEPKIKAGDMHGHESKITKEVVNGYLTRLGIGPFEFEKFIRGIQETKSKVPISGGTSPSATSSSTATTPPAATK